MAHHHGSLIHVAAAAAMAALAALSAHAAVVPDGFTDQTMATGLTTPTSFGWTPDGSHLFISEQFGRVWALARDPTTGALEQPNASTNLFVDVRPLLNLTGPDGTFGGYTERGLEHVTVDPGFGTANCE